MHGTADADQAPCAYFVSPGGIDDDAIEPFQTSSVAQVASLKSRAQVEWPECKLGAFDENSDVAYRVQGLSDVGSRYEEREADLVLSRVSARRYQA
jgi:hypothetical protein